MVRLKNRSRNYMLEVNATQKTKLSRTDAPQLTL